MKRKWMVEILLVAMSVSMFTACGNSTAQTGEVAENEETSETVESTEQMEEDSIHVVVAGTPGYEPFTYVGEDGNETGFDIEVMRAIDEMAPEIECEFIYSEWDALIPGLDAERFDVVCGQLSSTEERESMYTLETVPINVAGSSLITSAEHSDWSEFEDLAGANVECIVGSAQAQMVETYLEEHPDEFTLSYTEASLAQVIEDIANGRADATFEDGAVARSKASANGYENSIFVADKLYNEDPVFYLMAKTDKGQQIAEIIDKYLPELYYNGTLTELAQKYVGADTIIKALPQAGYYTETTLEEYRENHQ